MDYCSRSRYQRLRSGLDERLGDGLGRRRRLLPGFGRHRIGRQRRERSPLDPSSRSDHAEERPRHQEPLRDPVGTRRDFVLDAGELFVVVTPQNIGLSINLVSFKFFCNSVEECFLLSYPIVFRALHYMTLWPKHVSLSRSLYRLCSVYYIVGTRHQPANQNCSNFEYR